MLPCMRRVVRLALIAFLLGTAAVGLWLLASENGQTVWREASSRSPNDVIRYLKRRLEGHPKLEAMLLPPLHAAQRRLEREPPPGPLPTLGKGQQARALANAVPGIVREWPAATPQEIRQAMQQAMPGTRIVIAPGLYPFDRNLGLGHDGTRQAPIVLSAAQPGTVWLEFKQLDGILVNRPHWVFENLDIRGTCARHHQCEHAFHVVGRGAFTTIRNNRISDFNAHVKVNGHNGEWPDHGLLAFNTLTNAGVRETNLPVTPFDLVGASHWQVQDNLVSHFVKRDGNRVSYGIFMKGASEGGRIERNLVICSLAGVSDPGVRVGISFGGGETGARYCRDGRCEAYEHRNGWAANNIVAHCNDAGLDVNRSSQILLAHNTLINTSGVVARGQPTDTRMYGNLYEGVARVRDGGLLQADLDRRADAQHMFEHADALALAWRHPPDPIPTMAFAAEDFRRLARGKRTSPGALH